MAFNKFTAVIFTICALIPTIMSAVAPSPTDFFKTKIEGNLTKITWSHETNTKALLTAALNDEKNMMVEADVIFGKLNTTDPADAPIMGHSDTEKGDLTLEQFLTDVIANKKHGIKLDFKSLDAFTNSMPILKKLHDKLEFPVWLNADILKGPLNADEPVITAKKFFDDVKTNFPESILSIGWTTKYEKKDNTTYVYAQTDLDAMAKALTDNKVAQVVTYPLRANFVMNNTAVQLNEFLKKTEANKPTLTIWSDPADTVDAVVLSKLIRDIGVDKVYVDVPKELYEKLQLSSAVGHLPGVFVVMSMFAINFFVNIF